MRYFLTTLRAKKNQTFVQRSVENYATFDTECSNLICFWFVIIGPNVLTILMTALYLQINARSDSSIYTFTNTEQNRTICFVRPCSELEIG